MVVRLFNASNKIKWLILSLLAISLILLGLKLWRISIPARSLYNTYGQVQQVRADPASLEVATLQPLLHQTHLDLVTLQQELRPFSGLLRNLGWLPRVGGDVQALPDLLALGASLTEAGDIILTAMNPVVQTALGDDNVSSTTLIPMAIQTLAQAEPEFARARQSLVRARQAREQIQIETLSPRLAEPIGLLDQVLPLSELAFEAVKVAPDLLGATEPRTYLVIAQNNDELRPTGGFISAIGTLTLDQGNIVSFTFEDSYAIDDFSKSYPDAPPQLLRYMQSEIWLVRDANWSPDFPTTVKHLLDLYAISRPAKVDGVIAVDQLALQEIVAALEPIHIPNWEEPATGENVVTLIRQSWSPEGDFSGWDPEWWRNRKNFIGDLVAATRARVETSPQNVNWPKLAQAVLRILDERHVQIWLADETAQTLVQKQAWDGAIQSTTGDYLMVVDTNLGFNKVNAVVQTSLLYEVRLAKDGPAEALLTVTHQNNGQGTAPCVHRARYGEDYWEIINRCFWNYLRVYTPRHSQLRQATPHAVPAKFLLSKHEEPARVETLPPEADKTVWGTFFMVPHGQSIETTFQYDLPAGVIEKTQHGWRYSLKVQKQAGTLANPLHVRVHLPKDSQVTQVLPLSGHIKRDNLIIFDLVLQTDQEIEISFE